MNVDQWELFGPDAQLRTGVAHTMRNRVNDRSLKYGEREYGINLVWDRSPTVSNIRFDSGGAGAVIRFGDRVSISVAGGGHFDYGEREYGINLNWSAAPTRQWCIGGGAPGTPVRTRQRFRLTNLEHGDYLVYGERDYGINLRWWADVGGYGSYPPLPMPEQYRSPSGEPGQIELRGIVDRIKIFHGGTDDELDWCVHIRPDAPTRRALFSHVLGHGKGAKTAHVVGPGATTPLVESDLNSIECELMVLDGYDNSFWDELFYSADVTEVLQLEGSAWDHSADVGDEQNVTGASKTVNSALLGKSVRVQGPFVNDADHRFKVEIHPFDSIAYPVAADGTHLDAQPGSSKWPRTSVTWRVAVFTNSSFHRINGADYVGRNRHTRWLLDLPSEFRRQGWSVTERLIGFTNEGRRHGGLDDRRPTSSSQYDSQGVVSHSAAIATDPRDNTSKLIVDVTMATPTDRWGGMFFAEYTVKQRIGPGLPGTNIGGVNAGVTLATPD